MVSQRPSEPRQPPEKWFNNKDYTCILFRHEQEVRSWSPRFNYNNEQTCYVLQYFIQLTQVIPSTTQDIIYDIFQERTPQITEEGNWLQLHEHDPLRVFTPGIYIQDRPVTLRGVPPKGYVFGNTQYADVRQRERHRVHGEHGFQIPGFAPACQPLPIGTTIFDTIERYPNHLTSEFIDAFIKYGITPGNVVDVMPDTILTAFLRHGVMSTANPYNVILKRYKQRREKLVAAKGGDVAAIDRVERYLNSEIQIFAIGTPSQGQRKALVVGRTQYTRLHDM
jgi:hypothetical protein